MNQKLILYLITLLFISHKGFTFAYPYEKMELAQDLTKDHLSLNIIKKTPLTENNKIFKNSYWKIYYQQNKIVGEELYIKGNLSYYYIYYYTKEKIFQKGFFWHGIYREIMSVKLGEKNIKQGFIYKNIPDSYRVYNASDNQLIYSYIYPNKEI